MRRIVLPQAARVIIPPLGNEFNNMLKTTSLLFVLGVAGAVQRRSNIKQGNTFQPFEIYLAVRRLVPAPDDDLGLHPGLDRAPPGQGTPGSDGQRGPGLRPRLIGFRSQEPAPRP